MVFEVLSEDNGEDAAKVVKRAYWNKLIISQQGKSFNLWDVQAESVIQDAYMKPSILPKPTFVAHIFVVDLTL